MNSSHTYVGLSRRRHGEFFCHAVPVELCPSATLKSDQFWCKRVTFHAEGLRGLGKRRSGPAEAVFAASTDPICRF